MSNHLRLNVKLNEMDGIDIWVHFDNVEDIDESNDRIRVKGVYDGHNIPLEQIEYWAVTTVDEETSKAEDDKMHIWVEVFSEN